MTIDASAPLNLLNEARAPETVDGRLAAGLRGFGPLGILSTLVILAGNAIFETRVAHLVFK